MKLFFPPELPVSQRRDEIRAAMERHPVVIVCGDTGSGKTTQLPKIAMELGRGGEGKRIGCTQPRRIAAVSVAERLAEEMEVPLGREVGYQIRFQDHTDRSATRIKFMTDGVLLAETRKDRDLRQYDTLIIDEAHERSLNIDFILGYLHRVLARRRDLRVLVSSATLDAGAFSDFFGGAPVVEVEGRTFPIEDLYQPALSDDEPLAEQIVRAVESLAEWDRLGDTLVFLPGEREIREATDILEGRNYRDTLVLPLFARQAAVEQSAIFHPVRSKRRIILATNVAETSLTIPDIRFVVDSGLARISRHDASSGIQRLRVETISKASARQRRGRCGRIGEGVCVRLGTEEDFAERAEYTDPEIRRSNLSGVVLQMEHLGLGDPLEFPFVDPPPPKRVAQAYRELQEIGALSKEGKTVRVTGLGHSLARMPLDPRVGRVLIAAETEDCLREGLIVASALAVQDPHERPRDRQKEADEAHAKFRDKRSDFTTWLRIWHAADQARRGSGNRLRRFCRENFFHHRRMQEWFRLHRELRDTLRQMKWKLPADRPLDDPADSYSEPLHRALLAAIPSRIGLHRGQKGQGYKGANDSSFYIFPGSNLFGGAPSWVMAFELVETSRLYARNVAIFDPGWFEKVAPHLCRYRYSNPHWSKEQGVVYGEERVIAYGLPVVEKRRIHYERVDARVAREIFMDEALVNGNTRAPLGVLAKNRATMAAAEQIGHKLRRGGGGLIHLPQIAAFYDERVPRNICTQKEFERWIGKQAEGFLDMSLEDCLVPLGEEIAWEDFPDALPGVDGEGEIALHYLHAPATEEDGITAILPLGELAHLPPHFGDDLVPGWLEEKVSALLRCLRKETRVLLPSNREVSEDFVERYWDEGEESDSARSLLEKLSGFLEESYQIKASTASFDLDRLPIYLRMRFEVWDDKGQPLAHGRDLEALQDALATRVKERFSSLAKGRFSRRGIQRWDFGDLPPSYSMDRHTVGYPGLYDEGTRGLSLRLWPSPECAARQHGLGVARLYRYARPEQVARLEKALFSASVLRTEPVKAKTSPKSSHNARSTGSSFLSLASAFDVIGAGGAGGAGGARGTRRDASSASSPGQQSVASPSSREHLRYLTHQEGAVLSSTGAAPSEQKGDLLRGILGDLLGRPRSMSEWEGALVKADRELFDAASRRCRVVSRIVQCVAEIDRLLNTAPKGYEESIADGRTHMSRLMAPGWLLVGDFEKRLVYFQGLELRLTRMLGGPPAKDLQKLYRYLEEAGVLWADPTGCECGHCPPAAQYAGCITEDNELRLKYFAPELRRR